MMFRVQNFMIVGDSFSRSLTARMIFDDSYGGKMSSQTIIDYHAQFDRCLTTYYIPNFVLIF